MSQKLFIETPSKLVIQCVLTGYGIHQNWSPLISTLSILFTNVKNLYLCQMLKCKYIQYIHDLFTYCTYRRQFNCKEQRKKQKKGNKILFIIYTRLYGQCTDLAS